MHLRLFFTQILVSYILKLVPRVHNDVLCLSHNFEAKQTLPKAYLRSKPLPPYCETRDIADIFVGTFILSMVRQWCHTGVIHNKNVQQDLIPRGATWRLLSCTRDSICPEWKHTYSTGEIRMQVKKCIPWFGPPIAYILCFSICCTHFHRIAPALVSGLRVVFMCKLL